MKIVATKKQTPGRPMVPARRHRRAPLSLLVRPEIKRLVDKLATANGITQSAAGEWLIEQGLAVREMLDAMTKAEREAAKDVDAALRRRGYQRHRFFLKGKAWFAWMEPGFPIPEEAQTGFVPWKPGEFEALYPEHDKAPPDPTELPPVPPELKGSDPDRLYLVPENGVWTWKAAPPPKGEGK